jgi:serine/threonine-protein kinase
LVQRFIQEAQAVNAIKNEHIVEVYDFGEVHKRDGTRLVYCVMELLEGEALSETLNRGPLAVKRAASIGVQLGRALHAAHQVGVIHRDIKPENIFLQRKDGREDFVKVLDFGVAKLLKPIGNLPQSGTLAGVVVGTPEYMAPEQALGVSADLRSDLYAVGLVLYELLTGVQPFHGDTFGQLVVAITQTLPPPLPAVNSLNEPLPRGLANVVLKCLNKEPDARYDSGEKLAQALEPWTKGVAVPDAAPSAPQPDEPVVAVSRLPKLVAALAALLGLGVGAAFLMRADPAEGVPSPVAVVPAGALAQPEPTLPPPVAKAEQTITLEVTSAPAGARVARADTGELLGVTPLSTVLPKAKSTGLLLTLEGYEPEARDVNLSQSVSLGIDLRPKKVAADKKRPAAKKKANVNNDGTVDPFEQ